ncbi:GDP-4-dehydro-6-deoxy-D-mannose reductase [Heliobacterium gestii]|nr:GDP-4-dehydro-6-deoxy-D-mannose reductase [Heliomicrobium gestii]
MDSFNNPLRTYAEIAWGTLHVLEAIRRLQLPARLLYVSSSEVYGQSVRPDQLLTENTIPQPMNPYAAAKAWGEIACCQYAVQHDLPVMIARPFNHTGPGQNERFVCSNFAKQLIWMKQGRIPHKIFVGNLNVERDFLDVRDVVRAYHLLMTRGKSGQTYNVCSGKPIQIGDILRLMIQMSGLEEVKVCEESKRVRMNDRMRIAGSFDRLNQETDWRPRFSMDETLRDLLAYWKQNISVPGGRSDV